MSEPLVHRTRVACDVDHAFDVFTTQIDSWWPRGHRKLEGSAVHLEPGVRGRFLERTSEGEEFVHGEVIRWEPPHALAYTWRLGSEGGPTEVAVRFSADGEHTMVEVVHSEAASGLGDLWPERVQRFDRAWRAVLPHFAEHAARRG